MAAFAGSAPVAGASQSPPVRLGHLPRLPANATAVGALPGATPMHITIALKPRSPAALAAYARSVSTPGSGAYRDYLTPSQFARRFAPSRRQLTAVEASLRSHGLTPGPVGANRLSISVRATAARIERAFSLSFRRMQLTNGRRAVVASAPPAIDAPIAGDVQAVLGLASAPARPLLERPSLLSPAARGRLVARAAPYVATGGPQPCTAASSTASRDTAHTADQVASAYGFSGLYGAGDEGQGVTIAIYELEPNDPNDIATFQSCYGTSASVSDIPVDGGPGSSGPGGGEAALDIEQVISYAPKATLLVYQGPNANQTAPGSGPYDVLNEIVSQDRAQVISNSWGQCEQVQGSTGAKAESTLLEEAAVQGQSFVSATGDEGSEDCNGATNGLPDPELAVDDPGGQPFATGVGGTTLSSLGPPPSESVWNTGGNPTGLLGVSGGAGGGGVSHLWTMPGYQSGAASFLDVIQANSSKSSCSASSGFCRQVPDVSADADPNTGYVVYYNGSGAQLGSPSGWQAIGGTSAAAPLWAALLADVDASSACNGSPVGFANPALYQVAGSAYASDFNDVTTGNNDLTGTNGGLYPAQTGYDMATGLGSPNAAGLAPGLCAGALRITSPGAQVSTVHHAVRLTIRTSAPAGSHLTFQAVHLPPGLSISSSTGVISGKPRTAGRYNVTVAALDQSQAVRGVSFTWTVEGQPTLSAESLTGVAAGRPSLNLTVSAGRFAGAVSSVSIGLANGLRFGRGSKGVAVTGTGGKRLKFSSRVVAGRLVISLGATAGHIRITVKSPAINASGALAAALRARHASRLSVTVAVTDAQHHSTSVTARIKPRS